MNIKSHLLKEKQDVSAFLYDVKHSYWDTHAHYEQCLSAVMNWSDEKTLVSIVFQPLWYVPEDNSPVEVHSQTFRQRKPLC